MVDGMRLETLIEKLKNGTVKVLNYGHEVNPIVDKLETYLDIYTEASKNPETGKVLEYYESKLNPKIGSICSHENYCFLCGEQLLTVLVDEDTIILTNTENLKESPLIKTTPCKALSLKDAQMLVSEIKAPTGELIFANYFKTDEFYELPGRERYQEPSINCVAGRNKLMQYLATKNVGYGQMGNMSLAIYSNINDIIIGADNPEEDFVEDVKDLIEFNEAIEEYEKIGYLSLSVWRWQCADKKTLLDAGEKPSEESILVRVDPGRYRIEHYYDFKKKSLIYSRIYKT